MNLRSSDNNSAKVPTRLTLEGELRGYAFEDGGSLSLTANDVLIADQTRVNALLRERLSVAAAVYTHGERPAAFVDRFQVNTLCWSIPAVSERRLRQF